MYGELIPVGGGDPIPLLKKNLLVGRRESCDIVLRFPNVSAHHCQLHVNGGYWYVKDLKSRNGVKVNGTRVTEKRLDPGDELCDRQAPLRRCSIRRSIWVPSVRRPVRTTDGRDLLASRCWSAPACEGKRVRQEPLRRHEQRGRPDQGPQQADLSRTQR